MCDLRPLAEEVPTAHEVQAQQLVVRVVGGGDTIDGVRRSYVRLPLNGLYSSSDLLAAERALLSLGVLEQRDEWLYPTEIGREMASMSPELFSGTLLMIWLQYASPLWLSVAAANGALVHELVPEGVLRSLRMLLGDEAQVSSMLLAAHSRIDTARLMELGGLGELAVVQACRRVLAENGAAHQCDKVVRVSVISDHFGYDVESPGLRGEWARMEVKTCAAVGTRADIYLSRNEARVGACDPQWYLVVCEAVEDTARIIGWCTFSKVASLLPRDGCSSGRWQTAKLSLDVNDLSSGLPIARWRAGGV